jgi:predicted nucleic acid-binding Zn ribbon protein
LTEKQIDDRNNRLKRNAILFLFYAFALIFLYAIFEDLIREYLKRF